MEATVTNGWGEWRKYVLKSLENNSVEHREILICLRDVEREVARLKVQAGLWGLMAGLIPGLGVLIVLAVGALM